MESGRDVRRVALFRHSPDTDALNAVDEQSTLATDRSGIDWPVSTTKMTRQACDDNSEIEGDWCQELSCQVDYLTTG